MSEQSGLQEVSQARARELLTTQQVGRLVLRVGDVTDIFPINYWSDGVRIVFRTGPGTKLAAVAVGNEVLLETDEVTERLAWSVVARGSARILTSEQELAEAEQLAVHPLWRSVKPVFAQIDITRISGREFVPEPGPSPEVEPETAA